MLVEEDIRFYKDSWVKRQILATWERIRKRAGARFIWSATDAGKNLRDSISMNI
jgi:hypothetical protein